jgi:hypothetical protein
MQIPRLVSISSVLGLALLLATNSYAHHSFSAMYDAKKPIRLSGVLSKVEWTNPHSYFYIDVTSKDGRVNTWAAEGAGPGALSRRGFKRGDIKVGDRIVVDGYLARSGAKIIDARRVTLPDGRVVGGGTPGDGGPADQAPANAGGPSH